MTTRHALFCVEQWKSSSCQRRKRRSQAQDMAEQAVQPNELFLGALGDFPASWPLTLQLLEGRAPSLVVLVEVGWRWVCVSVMSPFQSGTDVCRC